VNLFERLRGRRDVDRDLADELAAHLDARMEELARAGLPREDAHRQARRELGNATLLTERGRNVWRFAIVEDAWQDSRYAWRQLRRAPAFTTAAILTLALGIGASTAVFSVVNAVLLRPLPFPGSTDLVSIGGVLPAPGMTEVEISALRSRAQTLTNIGVYFPAPRSMVLTGGIEPVRLDGIEMTPSVLEMVEAQPLLGRSFAANDDQSATNRQILLSHTAWHRHFGGDPLLVGKTVSLDGNGFTVIGVMPPSFRFPDSQAQFWIPLAWPRQGARLGATARLKPGVSIEAATIEINAIVGQLRENTATAGQPAAFPSSIPSVGRGFSLLRLHDSDVNPVRPALRILTVAVGFVLLIACVNVANLLLARSHAREREIAVRHALGAGRGRLIRQMFVESALLAFLGGVAGIVVAFGGIELLRTLGGTLPRRDVSLGAGIPRLDEVAIDGSALAFTIAATALAAALFGLAPAFRHAAIADSQALHTSARFSVSGFRFKGRHRPQALLVIVEIAAAMMLLVGSGLLFRSFINLVRVDPGYDPRGVLTFRVRLPRLQYPVNLPEEVVERIKSVPGVEAAAYARVLPLTYLVSTVTLSGSPPAVGAIPPPPPPPTSIRPPEFPDARHVSREYLDVMRIRMIAGRGFLDSDAAGRQPVILINQTLARSGLFGSDPIGRQVYALGPLPWQIVGIVEDSRQFLDAPPAPQVFFDARQLPRAATSSLAQGPLPYFVVRADGDVTSLTQSIRDQIRQIDSQALVDDVATMEHLISTSLTRQRLYAVLLGIFAAAALVLAGIGLYGVVAYAVVQQTHEIGVRMALGAERLQVLKLVLGQSMALTAVGLVLGLVGAASITRYLAALLFGLTPLDSGTFIVVTIVFAVVAALASYVPAQRATKADPLEALRCE
jgi:putative ABC transport system permease protein